MTVGRLRRRLSNRSLARGLPQRIYGRFRGQLYVDRGAPGAALFLAGSPRSGTTWVAEMVATAGNVRLLFEPFHPDEVPLAAGFGRWRYLRPSDQAPELLDVARRITTGAIRSSWTDRFNRAIFPRQRLIKEVRANLLLGWLHAQFPNMPIAFVLRHPLAVAASQQGVGWDFSAETEALLSQTELLEDHLDRFRETIAAARAPGEQAVAMWCAENYVSLHQFEASQVHLVCYEHLVMRPESEFPRLLAHFGLPFRPELLRRIQRPSGVTAKNSPIARGEDALKSWKEVFDVGQTARLLSLLEPFGLNRLYGNDPLPLQDDPNELLR